MSKDFEFHQDPFSSESTPDDPEGFDAAWGESAPWTPPDGIEDDGLVRDATAGAYSDSPYVEIEGVATRLEPQFGASPESPVIQTGDQSAAAPDLLAESQPLIESQYDEFIVVSLRQSRLTVHAGATVRVEIELLNNGDETATFQIHVEGWLDTRWVDAHPIHAQLRAGERTSLALSISPPREPATTAGDRPIAFVVQSANYPGRQSRLGALLTIHAYDDILLGDLRPRRLRVQRSGRPVYVTVPVYNHGNHSTQVQLAGDALHDDCLFEFRDRVTRQTHLGMTILTLDPGETESVKVSILPGRRPFVGWRNRSAPFRLLAGPAGKAQVPQAANGELIFKPVVGPRQLTMVAGLLFAFLFLASLIGFAGYTFLEFASTAQRAQGNNANPQQVVAIVVPVDKELPSAAPTQPQQIAVPAPVVVSVGDGNAFPTGGISDDRTGETRQLPVIQADQISAPGVQAAPTANAAAISRGQPEDPEPKSQTYAQMFRTVAAQHGHDWRMLAAQAYIESSFDPLALGKNGDLGLMQILPNTWKEFAPQVGAQDPFDSHSNVQVAAFYLTYLQDLLREPARGDIRWVLVAYNWGPDEVLRYLESGQTWDELSPNLRKYADDVLRIADSIPNQEAQP